MNELIIGTPTLCVNKLPIKLSLILSDDLPKNDVFYILLLSNLEGEVVLNEFVHSKKKHIV